MRPAVATRGLRLVGAALVVVSASVGAACNASEQVDLAFRPAPGDHRAYDVDVVSEVVTELVGAPETTTERLELRTEERVLDVADDGTLELEITAGTTGGTPRSFEVRLDPGRDLAVVERVEGLPLELLGELGPSRLVVLANGLLPDGEVRPGATWHVEQVLALPDGETRLSGSGRLASLERRDGADLAHVVARTTIPVERSVQLDVGRVEISGTETTIARLVYDLADGGLESAVSRTLGLFELVVEPPAGRDVEPVRGSLEFRLEATSERVPL